MARCWHFEMFGDARGISARRPDKAQPPSGTGSAADACTGGGLTRFARPAGTPLAVLMVCPTCCRPLSNPGRGFSSPLARRYMRKKSPHFHASSSSNMAVRGGVEPPQRCPIHTFPAGLFPPPGPPPIFYPLCCGAGGYLRKKPTAGNPPFYEFFGF